MDVLVPQVAEQLTVVSETSSQDQVLRRSVGQLLDVLVPRIQTVDVPAAVEKAIAEKAAQDKLATVKSVVEKDAAKRSPRRRTCLPRRSV